MSTADLYPLAQEVLGLLARTRQRLVCAESCTAGMVSATLAGIPGASHWLCGSAVVYRNQTKTDWIGVPKEVLDDPARGDVCEETARRMVLGVLDATPEATIAVSITGHLGPGSPTGLDGVIYVGMARRGAEPEWQRWTLQSPTPQGQTDLIARVARQTEAAEIVLRSVQDTLQRWFRPL